MPSDGAPAAPLEGVPYPSAQRGNADRYSDDWQEKLAMVDLSSSNLFSAGFARLGAERKANQAKLDNSFIGMLGRAVGIGKERDFEKEERKRLALIESAKALGIERPFRATEEDVARAEAEARERAEVEAKLVEEAAAQLAGRSALSITKSVTDGSVAEGGGGEAGVELSKEEQIARITQEIARLKAGGGDEAAREKMTPYPKDKESLFGWDAEDAPQAIEARQLVEAADAAAAAFEAAVASTLAAAEAGAPEEEVLQGELRVRELKEAASTASDAAADARGALMRQAQEVQAGLSADAAMAVTAAKAAKARAEEAKGAADAAVRVAAAAVEEAAAAAREAE